MCEIFGVIAKDPFYANDYLKTFYSHSDKHPHGWGLACINKDEAMIEKESKQASNSNYLKERLSQPINSKIVLGHIRYATIGNIDYRNCHPYSGKDNFGRRWTLIHNGTIFDYPALNTYLKVQVGHTDSERIFLYLLDRINTMQSELERKLTFDERFDLIDEIINDMSKGNKLNLIISDGRYLYVHTNCVGTLHYIEKNDAAVFSTQPLDNDNWEEVKFGTPLAYKNGRLVKTGTTHTNEYIENNEAMKFLYQIFSDL